MDKKFFWTPNINWCINDESVLCIEECCFDAKLSELFPEFYFILCQGVKEENLLEHFPKFPKTKLKRFVRKLKEMGFISDTILDIYQIFDKQNMLFQPTVPISHDYFFKKENVEQYRAEMLSRKPPFESIAYKLDFSDILPDAFFTRRSVRNFDTDNQISFKQLSAILQSIAQYQTESGRKYCYPSAGGLYPIDCYIHFKSDRVEFVNEGLYFFDAIRSTLNYISSGHSIERGLHHFINRDIFETSAFTVYLFYNANVSMPKYESRAYYYGIYDAGILTGYLNIAAETVGVSSCSIGSVKNFDEIKEEFHLTEHQIFLHSIEFGLREKNDN